MKKIFLCTPAFEAKLYVPYAISLAESYRLLNGNGIDVEFRIHASGSLLCAERNRLTEAFMESNCTHMLCIDADIGWNPKALLAMIEKDVDFIAGSYPSRREQTFLFRPVFKEDNSINVDPVKGLLEMQYIPAGFMLISRKVIETMREKYPELYFCPKHPDSQASKGYCFFNTELRDGEFWGEDYVFCRLAREAGFQIWVDPSLEFDHNGTKGALIQALTQEKDKAAKAT